MKKQNGINNLFTLLMLLAVMCCMSFSAFADGSDSELSVRVTSSAGECKNTYDRFTQTYDTASFEADDFTIELANKMGVISRVEIEWAQPSGENVASYKLYRSVDHENYIEVKDRASGVVSDRKPNPVKNGDDTSYITTDTFDDPIYASEIKLSIVSTTANIPASIREIRVYGTVSDSELISKGKSISVYGGDYGDLADELNDSNYTNGIDDTTSRLTTPLGVIVDLGGIYKVSDLYCTFVDRLTSKRNAYTYTVYVSMDGKNFTDVIKCAHTNRDGLVQQYRNKTTSAYNENGFYLTQNTLDDRYARYVKVEVTRCLQSSRYGIMEIEVLGKSVDTIDRISASYDENGKMLAVDMTDEVKSFPIYLGESNSQGKNFLFDSINTLVPYVKMGQELYLPDSDAEQVVCIDSSAGKTFDVTVKVDGSIYAFQTELVFNPLEVECVSSTYELIDGTQTEKTNGTAFFSGSTAVGYVALGKSERSQRMIVTSMSRGDNLDGGTVTYTFRARNDVKTVMYLKGTKCYAVGSDDVIAVNNCLLIEY